MKKLINFKPLGSNILVEHAIITKSPFGLDLPETAWKFKEEVEVLAKGSQVKEVSIGDKVRLNPNRHATEITIGDVKYLILDERDLLGIITKQPVLSE